MLYVHGNCFGYLASERGHGFQVHWSQLKGKEFAPKELILLIKSRPSSKALMQEAN